MDSDQEMRSEMPRPSGEGEVTRMGGPPTTARPPQLSSWPSRATWVARRGERGRLRRRVATAQRCAPPCLGCRYDDRVLDVGCGAAQTTRSRACRRGGRRVRVDLSAPAIHRARKLADAEGLRNATFEVAGAQVHHFPPNNFDVVISRFGTMFFDDPVARSSTSARPSVRSGGW